MKILLIEMWLGPLPEYYQYHFETMQKQNENIDIFFFTDQIVDFDVTCKNYHIINVTLPKIQERFQKANNRNLILKGGNAKITDLKLSYFVDMFSDIVDYKKYDYFGIHDIDTLFGNIYEWVSPYLGIKKFISIGGGVYHERLSGPLLLFKNDEEILNLFKTEDYYKVFETEEIYGFGEQNLDLYAKKIDSFVIIQRSQNVEHETSKILYDTIYRDGKVYCNENEILCSHFYHKKNVEFDRKNDTIITRNKQNISDDFYWVTYCTKSYEHLLINLLKSVKNYSTRKIIVYTVNYNFDLEKFYQYNNSQFEFIRYDMEEGWKDELGRDFNIISFKPKICLEITKKLPNDKFIFIDTDIHFTTNSDDLFKFLPKIEHYPLFNSHVHDIIYLSNVIEGEQWSDTVGLILKEMNINEFRLFPRRKTNIFLFNKNCDWYFKEQIELFETLKSNNKLFLLRFHDEDLANVILTKYSLTELLPLVDIEESYDLSLQKIQDYSYSMTSISPNVIVPKNINDIYFFHGFKKIKDYQKIEEIYGNTILKKNDILFIYEKNTLSFIRNNFLYGKNIDNSVSFILMDKFDSEISRLSNQNLFNYVCFYISDLVLSSNVYKLKIIEDRSQKIIYNNVFDIS